MPIYEYEHCGQVFEVAKPISQASEPEHCPRCFLDAEKIISHVQISPTAKAFEPHFNYGLGKKLHSKREMNEHLSRIRGETGKNIVEVGNDNLASVKPERKSYDLPEGAIDGIKASFGH